MIRSPSFSRLMPRHLAPLGLALVLGSALCDSALAAYPISFGGAGPDEVRVVKNAPNGDLFVAGQFRGSIEVAINGQMETLTSRGGQEGPQQSKTARAERRPAHTQRSRPG